MDIKIKSTALCALLATSLGVPSAAKAEDDNFRDGKNYPGTFCVPAVNATAGVRSNSFYANTSGATANVMCPVVQDSWEQQGGLTYSRMSISNVAGQVFSCTESSYDADGVFITSVSFSTTQAGLSAQYFFSGGSYLSATGNEGYIVIRCQVPNNGQIRGYQVEEKA